MAPSADPDTPLVTPPPSSSASTPTPSQSSPAAKQAPSTQLPTIPSDEDRSSEDGSHRSSSPRREQSETSSISDPAIEEAGRSPASDNEQLNGHSHETTQPEESTANSESAPPSKPRSSSNSSSAKKTPSSDNVQRLSAAEMRRLTNAPDSLPIAPAPPPQRRSIDRDQAAKSADQREALRQSVRERPELRSSDSYASVSNGGQIHGEANGSWYGQDSSRRGAGSPRNLSTPPMYRTQPGDVQGPPSPRRYSYQTSSTPTNFHISLDGAVNGMNGAASGPTTPLGIQMPSGPPTPQPTSYPVNYSIGAAAFGLPPPPSPRPHMIPAPPASLPTHLQLEIAAGRPSPLYIHQAHVSELPYESSAVKFERLLNVLLLPPYLERTLYFGALACLDAWLYNFTILPVRFILALTVLVKWWAYILGKEGSWLIGFVWSGLGRLWERGQFTRTRRGSDISETLRSRSRSGASEASADVDALLMGVNTTGSLPTGLGRSTSNRHLEGRSNANGHLKPATSNGGPGPKTGSFSRHRRTKSMPSNLSAFHKADLLQGAVIICSSLALMTLDASRMYHFIRAQSAIKLYVIYNILEVGDRLLSALGQDILECLFSTETLSRNASGRSKVLLPAGMFVLALVYNCLHSITLYYQVITLNVAVNSYSNALLTLLLSNQFVEIKSTVFKRIEKDNLFQLTCADIVERFQLWIMLLIIGMRNVVEVGGLSVPGAGSDALADDPSTASPGLHSSSILPHSFTVLPSWLMSGEVLSPFLIVVGSEMLVDTIKHAYVNKFNNIKPTFYSRILDILCKDYYTNAFTSPSLTRRLGLAVIPLSCLFIRASIQTYHMFLSTHLPMPMPPSTQTSLVEESAVPSSPAMIAALNRFDSLIRDSLGRATYGYPYGSPLNGRSWWSWTSDDFIAALTMVVVFFIAFLVLLMLKLLLGMALLQYSRNRYAKMKDRETKIAMGAAEPESYDTQGKRVGGHGEVEVGDERQRWIHADKSEGLKGGRGPGAKRAGGKPEVDLGVLQRFEMVAKRIW